MPKYGYLVVEGPHDVEFAYRLMAPFGLRRVQWERDLDPYMALLVPSSFPHGGDLQKRVPVPLFLRSASHVIAVHSAIGDSRLVAIIEESRELINLKSDFQRMTGVGILLDTDREIPAAGRYTAIKKGMLAKGFTLPDTPGTVAAGPPRIGAFVLPDNNSVGNLEDILIECAQSVYPSILATAKTHVDSVRATAAGMNIDCDDLTKVPVYNKALVGAIASVLRPGKAIQTSIQDNKWLRDDNLMLASVQTVQNFLVELFELQ